MKNCARVLFFSFIFFSLTSYAEDSIQKKIETFPLYWSFEYNNTYALSSEKINNYKSWHNNMGYNVDINLNIHLSKTNTYPRSGFSIAPGLGISKITFCINKDISLINDKFDISDIAGSYNYSRITGYYFDIPVDFRYRTKSNLRNRSICFDVGLKAGKLFYGEKEIQIQNENNVTTSKLKNIDFLNKFHYALTSKISYMALGVAKNNAIGMAISASCCYYFSNAFIQNDNTNLKLFSINLGLTFFFE